ncbi:hypothetical protein JRO89_XS01G0192100 [Xanthoceras sorbifolium]|uniref:Uncharacterized protein n=1 Tax=Xanthoceras sorbifolium TaxID=99658 RepID=A0ABQ8ILJ7_9ROSI|nr:hypothetical protein JRO89_XS01G0192100 [Xanthoceras sorbifolium]
METSKENIPPISENQISPVSAPAPAAPSFRRKFKRRPRVPLADITNLFNHSIQVSSDQENDFIMSPPVSVSVCTSNSRKRKATEDIDLREESSSPKSSIMGFR